MINEVYRVGELVVQQICKSDGTPLRYQYGKPGDASTFIHTQTMEEGRKAIIPPTLTLVDRNGEMTVHKVTKEGKLIGYRYNAGNGGVDVPTLTEARKAIGKDKVVVK